jgi:hypothetical protein
VRFNAQPLYFFVFSCIFLIFSLALQFFLFIPFLSIFSFFAGEIQSMATADSQRREREAAANRRLEEERAERRRREEIEKRRQKEAYERRRWDEMAKAKMTEKTAAETAAAEVKQDALMKDLEAKKDPTLLDPNRQQDY